MWSRLTDKRQNPPSAPGDGTQNYVAKFVPSIAKIAHADWQGLQAGLGSPSYNPFTDYRFLKALETSGSVGADTGWQPFHITVYDKDEHLVAAAPLYIKDHSMGEYVFDQGWADGAERAGLQYYPKLLCAVPFSPVGGPRLLAKHESDRVFLINALKSACAQFDLGGVHVNFIDEPTQALLVAAGFLPRTDRQFHFINKGYDNFAQFLAHLSSRKRKKIKSERRRAQSDVQIKRQTGDDLKPEHWDWFYNFYQNTAMRKWGQAYLKRAFFEHIHEELRAQILLVLAFEDDRPIAGALNFIGGDTLYGRHWGASKAIPFLHFELCYYQAIEAALEMGLRCVEAGAQGEHKLARGYEPVITRSAHYLAHSGLHAAVGQALQRERQLVNHHIDILKSHTPFKQER